MHKSPLESAALLPMPFYTVTHANSLDTFSIPVIQISKWNQNRAKLEKKKKKKRRKEKKQIEKVKEKSSKNIAGYPHRPKSRIFPVIDAVRNAKIGDSTRWDMKLKKKNRTRKGHGNFRTKDLASQACFGYESKEAKSWQRRWGCAKAFVIIWCHSLSTHGATSFAAFHRLGSCLGWSIV
jgi:hypothetical protein